MTFVPKSLTVDKEVYEEFRKECDKRAIAVSKWIRNCMMKQLTRWKNEQKRS